MKTPALHGAETGPPDTVLDLSVYIKEGAGGLRVSTRRNLVRGRGEVWGNSTPKRVQILSRIRHSRASVGEDWDEWKAGNFSQDVF